MVGRHHRGWRSFRFPFYCKHLLIRFLLSSCGYQAWIKTEFSGYTRIHEQIRSNGPLSLISVSPSSDDDDDDGGANLRTTRQSREGQKKGGDIDKHTTDGQHLMASAGSIG